MSGTVAVTIVDYGVGNLRSLEKMFQRIGVSVALSSDPDVIADATRLLLPGVGAFDSAITKLRAAGVEPALRRAALERGIPVLGVCLGMQLLGRSSAEGKEAGLGWIDATTELLRASEPDGRPLRLPHMGWASVRPTRENPLLVAEGPPRFYFVHSYAMQCAARETVLGEARYGTQPFTCAVEQGNVRGVQFHPEKSHRFGMDLLARFAAL